MSQCIAVSARKPRLNLRMGGRPDRNRRGKNGLSFCCQLQKALAPVGGIDENFHPASPLQGLEGRCQRGLVHGQKFRHRLHGRWAWPIERHHERELPVCKPCWAKRFVKKAGQRSRGALNMQAKAGITNEKRCFKRDFWAI